MILACVSCGLKMKVETIGVTALEFKDKEKTEPYRLWKADLMKCNDCMFEMLKFADAPYMFEHQLGFEAEVMKIERESYGKLPIQFY